MRGSGRAPGGKMGGRTFGVQSLRGNWPCTCCNPREVCHGGRVRRCCCRSCRISSNYTFGWKNQELCADFCKKRRWRNLCALWVLRFLLNRREKTVPTLPYGDETTSSMRISQEKTSNAGTTISRIALCYKQPSPVKVVSTASSKGVNGSWPSTLIRRALPMRTGVCHR